MTPASKGLWDFANVPQSGNVSMSHSLKLCTVKELKTVYGIPYSRQHILEASGRRQVSRQGDTRPVSRSIQVR